MPRTVAGPMWADGGRLAGHVALSLAEGMYDRVRLRRLLQQLGETASSDDLVLPSETDLVRDITVTIDRMRKQSPDPRRGELLHLVAVEGVERSKAAERLFLSERQFYRVRQEAAEELAEELAAIWRGRRTAARRAAAGTSVAGERLPVVRSFVGRAHDLEEAAQQLRTHGMLLVAGPPGIGKTSLGAQIASIESGRLTTVWHRFRTGLSDSPAAVLLTLGSAIAATGDDRLQQMIGRAAAQPLWLPGAIDLAKRGLSDRAWLLCFDDTDVIADNEPVCGLLQLLFEECAEVRMLLMGRSEIWRLPDAHKLVLGGLERGAVAELMNGFGVNELATDDVAALVELTGGSPQLLRLAANVLVHAARPEHAIAALQDEPDVNAFLLHHVFQRLKDDERQILKGAALLRSGVTAAFLARAFRDLSDYVPDALARLAQQFLLASTENGLRLHSSLRQFCRHQLTPEQIVDLSTRLARAYAAGGEVIEACHHWIVAGAVREARDALVTCRWQDWSVDRRTAVAELTMRVVETTAAPGDDLLAVHTDVSRSLGRDSEARDVLRAHIDSIRDSALLVTLAGLEREAGAHDAARAILSSVVARSVDRALRWRVWWEMARVERLAEQPDAALRAAKRIATSATGDDAAIARLATLGVQLLPSISRLHAGDEVPATAGALLESLLDLDPLADDGLTALLTLGAASHGLPEASMLLKHLRAAAGSSAALEGEIWSIDAVHAAAAGDYRTAGQGMWRAAERAAATERHADAAVAAVTAALYRTMCGASGPAEAHLDWASQQGESAATVALTRLVRSVRWLRTHTGPPTPLHGGPESDAPALAAVELLLRASGQEDREELVAEGVALSRRCAMDHRMILLDLAIELSPNPKWSEERRRLRLPEHAAAEYA